MQRLRQAGSAQKLHGNCSSNCIVGVDMEHRQHAGDPAALLAMPLTASICGKGRLRCTCVTQIMCADNHDSVQGYNLQTPHIVV
jgi:hypothetical protein